MSAVFFTHDHRSQKPQNSWRNRLHRNELRHHATPFCVRPGVQPAIRASHDHDARIPKPPVFVLCSYFEWVKNGSVLTWQPLVFYCSTTCQPLENPVLTHKKRVMRLWDMSLQAERTIPKLDVIARSGKATSRATPGRSTRYVVLLDAPVRAGFKKQTEWVRSGSV